MLAIGDKVVYPMHGAGVIEAIEEREIDGTSRKYFVLSMLFGDMRVMIPVGGAQNIGIRQVIAKKELPKVKNVLIDRTPEEPRHANWNRRFNNYLEKLKSGSIYEVAGVVRILIQQERMKKLSTGERRLLNTARQILISELMLSCSLDFPSAEKWLEEQLLIR